MSRKLICYFSATGITKNVAEKMAKNIDADLYEITPKVPYTKDDLDWTNDNSRSSIEMKNELSRPELKDERINIDNYDAVILGFPVWWYKEPTIINTFIESNNFNGKDVYVFVTSGSSPVDSSLNSLKTKYPNINFINGKRLSLNDEENYTNWIN